MNIYATKISEVLVIEPKVFGDERGYFLESFNQRIFEDAVGYKVNFVQDNHSQSQQGVLRGLHYQLAPFSQGKLVRCVEGEVFDVAVDLRRSSPTFGQWVGEYLSADNKKQLWIPEGFAHGFLAMSERVQFVYKTTNYYSPLHDRSILWNDKEINIEWPIANNLNISEKDRNGLAFSVAEIFD